MKNFLLERVSARRASWVLLSLHATDSSNVEYKPFTEYVEWLEFTKGYATATVDQYAGHVARFIDFVYEASSIDLKSREISDLLYLYQEFLLYALESENPNVIKLCKLLGKNKKTSISSVSQGIESAISSFITLQIVRNDSIEQNNVFTKFVTNGTLLSSSGKKAIKDASWVAGTVRGSLERAFINKRKAKVFSVSKRARDAEKRKFDNHEDYPLERIEDLLTLSPERKSACFHRDMAIYSLLAAVGCRTHEALQICVDDVDFKNRRIRLVNPFSRDNPGLSSNEFKKLGWKGRQTDKALPIYPFDNHFWEHLRLYIEQFYRTNVNHNFLFQKTNGRPYFTTARSDRNKNFRKYAKASGFDTIQLGLHSLRHMYGRYVLNYYPNGKGGYGMPIEYVQILMGHASLTSTKKYAIHDMDIFEAYFDAANRINRGQQISLQDVKRKFIDSQIEVLQEQKMALIEHV